MPEALSDDVRARLRCPESGQPLHYAPREDCSAFAAELTEGAWIPEDKSRAYPVRDGFPVLVATEAVPRSEPPC